jgi:outer membrane usher protein FimD/PapC
VPHQITNGQTADANAVMDNFNAVTNCVDNGVIPTGTPSAGNLPQFSGPNSITSGDLSGDVTTSGGLATTLSNSGVAAGAYTCANVTFDAKGRAVSATNGTCGGSGEPPTRVQFGAVRGTSNSQTQFSVTLGSAPTPGNLLISVMVGYALPSAQQGCPANFYRAYADQATSASNQGVLVCGRIAQSGDPATSTVTMSNPNGGETFAVFEFNGAAGFTATSFPGTTNNSDFLMFGARLNSTSYTIGITESDPQNTYSSISGASLIFDGTGAAGNNVNHPSVLFQIPALANVTVSYSSNAFNTPLVVIINIVA